MTTQATHPLLPATVIRRHTTFEWLDGRQFLILRWHYDHPEISDAIAITGVTDGSRPCITSTTYRGVYRMYAVNLGEDQWRFWRDAPGFGQQFTGTLSDDGNTITGQACCPVADPAGRTTSPSPTGEARQDPARRPATIPISTRWRGE